MNFYLSFFLKKHVVMSVLFKNTLFFSQDFTLVVQKIAPIILIFQGSFTYAFIMPVPK